VRLLIAVQYRLVSREFSPDFRSDVSTQKVFRVEQRSYNSGWDTDVISSPHYRFQTESRPPNLLRCGHRDSEPAIKRPGHEADNSRHSNAELQMQ
jgi:hypothetical protein